MSEKADELNQRLPDDKEVKKAIVEIPAPINDSGIETAEYTRDNTDSIIVTGSGSIFVAQDGELNRFDSDRVARLVYDDTGLDEGDEDGE